MTCDVLRHAASGRGRGVVQEATPVAELRRFCAAVGVGRRLLQIGAASSPLVGMTSVSGKRAVENIHSVNDRTILLMQEQRK
jgi:hypothetical protein